MEAKDFQDIKYEKDEADRHRHGHPQYSETEKRHEPLHLSGIILGGGSHGEG